MQKIKTWVKRKKENIYKYYLIYHICVCILVYTFYLTQKRYVKMHV